jgi:spermidine synthase
MPASILRTLLFSSTLFLSAGLMFMVQPMIGKMMLPYVGGSPSGWLVAMAFFQLVLLAGYTFAHILSRFSVRTHVAVVCALLASGLLMLPLQFRMNADLPDIPHVLTALFLCSSLPFFALSTIGSSLQRLFAAAEDNKDPYFLFAASNLGSFFGLLIYPFWAERHYGLLAQAAGWRCSYAILIAACVVCLLAAGRGAKKETAAVPSAAPTGLQRLRWVLLAFVPSSLMLGTTSYIAVEAGSIPFFWVIPLALYLLTFVLAFAKTPIISIKTLACLQPLTLALVVFVFLEKPFVVVMGHDALMASVIAFFFTACLCHFALAEERPPVARLTEYYLWIALGGALGGSFNAFIVPFIFPLPVEFIVAMLLAAWLYPALNRKISLITLGTALITLIAAYIWSRQNAVLQLAHPAGSLDAFTLGLTAAYLFFFYVRSGAALRLSPILRLTTYILGGAGVLAIAAYLFSIENAALTLLAFAIAMLAFWPRMLALSAPILGIIAFLIQTAPSLVTVERNFFGVWRIYDTHVADRTVRVLLHGSTLHDMEPIKPALDTSPHSYYYKQGPLGDVFAVLDPKTVGVIGLGAGALACYDAPGRHYTFFEIDRDVASIAQNYFGYFQACGTPSIVIGDGRKALAVSSAHYDLLIIDAFTSDMIPLHLVTKEAFATYLDRLAPKGVIAFHISSRYYDLRPALSAAASASQLKGLSLFGDRPKHEVLSSPLDFRSSWAVFSRDEKMLAPFKTKGWQELPKPSTRLWTDDYSDALSALIALKPAKTGP